MMLAGVPLPLGLLVLPLAVVQHPADGRGSVGVDLHQIEAAVAGDAQGFLEGNDAVVLAVRPYETDLFAADPVVYPKLSDTCPLSKLRATTLGQL